MVISHPWSMLINIAKGSMQLFVQARGHQRKHIIATQY